MLLIKGMKSLQLSLNELVPRLEKYSQTVSNAAYSKARAKFRHTAFIELNESCVLPAMYGDDDYKTFHGMRILAIDGSKIILPKNSAIAKEFGATAYANKQSSGEYCSALASVLYDVLNGVAVHSQLEHSHSYEGDLANNSLAYTKSNDLVIYDRGYCSYLMIARNTVASNEFLIRCPRNSFSAAQKLFRGGGPNEIITTLKAPKDVAHQLKQEGLPCCPPSRLHTAATS